MTLDEHMLVILMEECAEVAHRASKALRFGLQEVQPGQEQTNAERLIGELNDLFAIIAMMTVFGTLPKNWRDGAAASAKTEKVMEFLRYSLQCGTLVPEP